MTSVTTDGPLDDQLLRIASDPELRMRVYEHLREYCHQCRNRLNSLKLSIYLAMKQSSPPTTNYWTAIDRHYRELETHVELVQFLCRPLTLSKVNLGLDLLIEDRRERWTHLMASKGRELDLVPPRQRAVASFDVDALGRGLDSVVAWRAADYTANRGAKLRWWIEEGHAHLSWEELEPISSSYIQTEVVETEIEPPAWALPLLAVVVQAHGGNYQIQTVPLWRLDITWPT